MKGSSQEMLKSIVFIDQIPLVCRFKAGMLDPAMLAMLCYANSFVNT